jgi:hypothetical protein
LEDHIKKNELGGACGTYRRLEKCIQDFGGESGGIYHLEDLSLDGRISELIFKK